MFNKSLFATACVVALFSCADGNLQEECRQHMDCPEGLACSFNTCIDPSEQEICGVEGQAFCGQACVDTLSNLETCGGCGGCPELAGAEAVACFQGVCKYVCQEGFRDSDFDADNGCDCEPEEPCGCEATGPEVCDGVDNDCDGAIDEVGPAAAEAQWVAECVVPANAVVTGCGRGICLYACGPGFVDLNGLENDGCECVVSPEICDGQDNDCDGDVDESADECPLVAGALARCGREGCEYLCDPAQREDATAFCDDGLFCTGDETCAPDHEDADLRGCVAGGRELDDGVPCTLDGCDEEADRVVHLPDHSRCDDELFCNGAEACSAEGCAAGIPPEAIDAGPCSRAVCNEELDRVEQRERGSDGWVCIEPGTFLMGARPELADRLWEWLGFDDDEWERFYELRGVETQHQVAISRPMLVLETEVLQREWEELLGTSPSLVPCPDCPVSHVSFYEVLTFLNALSDRDGLERCYELHRCSGEVGTGCPGIDPQFPYCTSTFDCDGVTFRGVGCEGFRLPTEAEWEYFTRAGTTTDTFAGDVDLESFHCSDPVDPTPGPVADRVGWYCANSRIRAHTARFKEPNPWGLFDVLGNASELVWDIWSFHYYANSPETDPTGPGRFEVENPEWGPFEPCRVLRGGAYYSDEVWLVSANRDCAFLDSRGPEGFRAVRTLAP